MCIQHFIKIFHIVEDLWLFPYFGLGTASVSKTGIWQSHWLDLVGINQLAKYYQSIPKVSGVMGILPTVTFWPWHCLGQGKVAFGKSFVWIFSILMRIKKKIKIAHMVEDLRRLPYFHSFCFGGVSWSKKSRIWQMYWLDLAGIYLYVKIIKIFSMV